MEAEFSELNTAVDWRIFYNQICTESRKLSEDFTTSEAAKHENKGLNRYRDVYPFDHSRVLLTGIPETDYINASLVEVDQVSRKYILAQGPLPSTTSHFWSMVWEQKSKAVIMLNRVVEKGSTKCHQYWPEEVGGIVECEDVGLTVGNMSSIPGENYTTAIMKITDMSTGETREVIHFHYTTWPDFGVPSSPDAFLEFLDAVRESGSLESDVGPAVVHCSAGIGRSGTFCLVDSCLLMAELEGPDSVSVKDVLLGMRKYRMGLIQTQDQLKFSYVSILEGARMLGLVECVSPIMEASDSDSEDDIPPPLPPPRGESYSSIDYLPPPLPPPRGSSRVPLPLPQEVLTLQNVSSIVIKDAEPFNSLPSKLESPADESDSTEELIDLSPAAGGELVTQREENKLRRRKKEEEKIVNVQPKIKEREAGSRIEHLKEVIFPFCVGIVMIMAGGYFYFN